MLFGKTVRVTQDDLHGLIREAAKAAGEARALAETNRALQTTVDWMRVRLTQLEYERAQLLQNFLGLKVPVPQIESTAPSAVQDILSQTPSFEDIGDAQARIQGIGWDDHGLLKQS